MFELPTRREKRGPRTYTLRIRRRNFWLALLIVPVLLALLAIEFAGIDFRDQRGLYFQVKQAQASVSQVANDVKYLRTKLRATWAAEPKRLVLDVKSDDWARIVAKRSDALDRGLLMTSGDDLVPARFGTGEESLKAKIRLKGDLLDHLQHPDRWSFRVELRGDHAYHGMRRFSLQPPQTRNYLNEWVLHRMARDAGLLGLRYEFVHLSVNGNDLGIYALEEHFAKQVIESNARREGPIVRFEESTLWGVHQLDPADAYRTAPISAFGMKSAIDDPATKELTSLAISRLEALRRGELPIEEVFDLDATAHFFALCDLLGAHHALSYNNMRFYHDPVSALLEPIAFDGLPGVRIAAPAEALTYRAALDQPTFLRIFFDDPTFLAHYHRHLVAVSDPTHLDAFVDRHRFELERLGTIIRSQDPQERLDLDAYRENAATITRFLEDTPDPIVHLSATGGSVEIVNLRSRAMELVALGLTDGTRVLLRKPVTIAGYRSGEISLPVTIAIPEEIDDASSITTAELAPVGLAATHTRTVEVSPLPIHRDLSALPRTSTVDRIPWIRTVEHDAGRTVWVPSGIWRLEESLVLAPTERLILAEGTTLDLAAGAQIIAHGGITALGTADAPIVITSSEVTGAGVFITAAPHASLFRHTQFTHLDRPRKGGWSLTGAVTVHETSVRFEHCLFAGNRCEDALNVIRSDFEIIGCTFRGTWSDALDCDFANGSIVDSRFLDSGNDAIDTSGSIVEVRHVVIRGAGDKAVSAGEGSTLTSVDTRIEAVEIAVASKDDSTVRMSDLAIDGASLDFAVYNKKPEYGPGRVEVRFSADHLGGAPTFLLEDASTLTLDGVEQAPNQRNVVDDLYGVKYGKSSD